MVCTGRVARAGRSGCAYSLVGAGEVGYVIDLHLFLGRPLAFWQEGHAHSGKARTTDILSITYCLDTGDRDGVYGSIPQGILDDGNDFIKRLLSSNQEVAAMKRVSENAQKQYVRSRNQPAPESVKRAKQLPEPLPLHPLFLSSSCSEAVQQHQVLDSLRHYKPSQVCGIMQREKH